MQTDGGHYEEAFGVEGELLDSWSDVEFDRGLLAISLYKAIEDKISDAIRKDKSFVFLRRLRYFSLALASIYLPMKFPNRTAASLLESEADFQKIFEDFWLISSRELIDAHHQATETDKISTFALVRSEQRWKTVREKFSRYLKLLQLQ